MTENDYKMSEMVMCDIHAKPFYSSVGRAGKNQELFNAYHLPEIV